MGSQLYGWWKRCILFFNQKPLKGLCGLEFSLVDVLSCSSPTAKHLIWVQIISSCSYHLHLFFFFLIAKLHTPSMSRIHNLIFPSHALLTGNELWGRMFFFFPSGSGRGRVHNSVVASKKLQWVGTILVVDAFYFCMDEGTMNWDRMIHRMLPSSMTVVGLRTLRHLAAPPVSMFHMMMIDEISLFCITQICDCWINL
jgi:hypothetical protein